MVTRRCGSVCETGSLRGFFTATALARSSDILKSGVDFPSVRDWAIFRRCSGRRVACEESVSRLSTNALEDGGFDPVELIPTQCTEFANRASDRISRDTLRNERAFLEEGNLHLNFELRAAKRGSVEHDSTHRAIGIGER